MCLCVQSKRYGQEIVTRFLLRSFLILCVSVCPCVQFKRDGFEIIIRPFLALSLLYVCPCVRVSVRPVLTRCLGNYDQTTSRSFFTLCVSVCLCVWSKIDGYGFMIRQLLRSFFTLYVLFFESYFKACMGLSSSNIQYT